MLRFLDAIIKDEKIVLRRVDWEEEAADQDEAKAVACLGFLLTSYEAKFYWFEVFMLYAAYLSYFELIWQSKCVVNVLVS